MTWARVADGTEVIVVTIQTNSQLRHDIQCRGSIDSSTSTNNFQLLVDGGSGLSSDTGTSVS